MFTVILLEDLPSTPYIYISYQFDKLDGIIYLHKCLTVQNDFIQKFKSTKYIKESQLHAIFKIIVSICLE